MILQNNFKQTIFHLVGAFLIIILILLFSCLPIAADDSIAPKSLYLFTADSSEENSSLKEIHLNILNDSKLYNETNNIINEANSAGNTLIGLTLQIQSKIDEQSWKTHKAGDYSYIESDDMASEIKIFNAGEIDLQNHTLYIKARYAWILSNGAIYYGQWSQVVALGKNAEDIAIPDVISEAPKFSEVNTDFNEDEHPVFNIKFDTLSDETLDCMTNPSGSFMLNIMISENGGTYRSIRFQPVSNIKIGKVLQCSILNKDNEYESGTVTLKARYEWYTGGTIYYDTKKPDIVSPWSEAITKSIELWSNASDWAIEELNKAKKSGLIPSCLMGSDLTKRITRTEFAAAAVKVYEHIAGKTAVVSTESPFIDCSDTEVLKAYSLGIINGISKNKFAPDSTLTREQAAVMLTRIYKLLNFKGWSLENDSSFKLNYKMPDLFSDDSKISDYAKESVYFMVSKNIIKGIKYNRFAPKNTTTVEEQNGYANTTREQALLITQRMSTNLF